MEQVGDFGAKKAKRIRIMCRIKPTKKCDTIVEAKGIRTVEVKTTDGRKVEYTYDRVFGGDARQEDVYKEGISDLVNGIVGGGNASIIAYGQTGSGKTYTMLGDIFVEENKGLIPRAIAQLFNMDGIELRLSAIEIYLEKIRDLLDGGHGFSDISIREDKTGSFYAEGASEVHLSTLEQALKVLAQSNARRISARTFMNDSSSRGHVVCILSVDQRGKPRRILRFFDLAGSEKHSAIPPGAPSKLKQTYRESNYINRSLSALGNVINSLTTSRPHVPYRDSKLTLLLKGQFSSGNNACLILNCSSDPSSIHETTEALRFGARSGNIKPTITAICPQGLTLLDENAYLRKRVSSLESFINSSGLDIPGQQASAAALPFDIASPPSPGSISHSHTPSTPRLQFNPTPSAAPTPPPTPKLTNDIPSAVGKPSTPLHIKKIFESDPEFLSQIEQKNKLFTQDGK